MFLNESKNKKSINAAGRILIHTSGQLKRTFAYTAVLFVYLAMRTLQTKYVKREKENIFYHVTKQKSV